MRKGLILYSLVLTAGLFLLFLLMLYQMSGGSNVLMEGYVIIMLSLSMVFLASGSINNPRENLLTAKNIAILSVCVLGILMLMVI